MQRFRTTLTGSGSEAWPYAPEDKLYMQELSLWVDDSLDEPHLSFWIQTLEPYLVLFLDLDSSGTTGGSYRGTSIGMDVRLEVFTSTVVVGAHNPSFLKSSGSIVGPLAYPPTGDAFEVNTTTPFPATPDVSVMRFSIPLSVLHGLVPAGTPLALAPPTLMPP
ncbi:uncharacterized protein AMSG_11604 [Thecamonas trahens ATCC 50062]|uniref:Uncharacterized protein n=1 Tax=Thecamonas trahens ATCC 50062 TaxID=461836 RepID=A0A0L0D905_THETB|nr:hypothetical protein AMSG_11604 [Thecamonas trahens ATCC 50062]KNC48710.1 hypothetical protein AMSG_11604 [Thecamonas trahens ATCC 50062]|eukprot:XP_013762875.1 hypothetical protein AMSG_11604 [Thecamonas trahens ATCC 50062]